MNGQTSKALKQVARIKYREMQANAQMIPPESYEHMMHQQRVLYRQLKKVYGSMPLGVRQRFLEPVKKSLIVWRDSRSNRSPYRRSSES